MNRKPLIIAVMLVIFAVIIIGIASLGGGIGGRNAGGDGDEANNGSAQSDPNVIVVSGIVKCLTGTPQQGQVQAQSCGVAISTENSEVFSLTSQNPSLLNNLSVGQRIEVTGSRSMSDEESGTDGVIEATAIKKL